jgi:pyruvate dehydrogenase E1 component beta subunit
MPRKISMKQSINAALDQEMARDPLVNVTGEDPVGGASMVSRWCWRARC